MFLEKIKSEGLAHLSYILGDGRQAAVIDPRRDCQIYVDIAAREGARITHIFETHRNEDYVIGSLGLARRTGATIYHGQALDFDYGNGLSEGDCFELGDLRLKILETPGHTYESISVVVVDAAMGDAAVAVFTGDTLFVGDVGRTDFYPDRPREVAGLLYDSLFKKLLPLGDQALLYPAHGAGSVCGNNMASREFSTLGHERLHNPVLQKTERDEFIQYKVNEQHHQPAYFRKMEEYNRQGPPALDVMPVPPPLNAEEVEQAAATGALLLDLRSPEAFAGAFIPGSLALPLELIPAYAGYLLTYDDELVLIPETDEQVARAVTYLIRMGFDHFAGYLKSGMTTWEESGRDFDRIASIPASQVYQRLRERERFTLLDVRKRDEFEAGHLAGATHIFLGDLPELIDKVDRERPVVTLCSSGQRAIIAASLLKRQGYARVENNLGSMSACARIGCKIETGARR